MGRTECPADRAKATAARDQARARYLGALTGFELNAGMTASEERTLIDAEPDVLGTKWHRRVASGALTYVLEQALADDVLTQDEEAQVIRLARLAKVNLADVLSETAGLDAHLSVARANSGRLPVVAAPTTRLRRREVCHLEMRASLMTDAAGSAVVTNRGVPVAKSTRIEYGRLRASLVSMNPDLRAWDDGLLLVTDQRLFFEGNHLTIQIPHRRLIGFTLFKDGVQVRVAGRKAEPIFRLAEPLIAAAIAGMAWAGGGQEPLPRVYAVESFDDLPVTAGSARSG